MVLQPVGGAEWSWQGTYQEGNRLRLLANADNWNQGYDPDSGSGSGADATISSWSLSVSEMVLYFSNEVNVNAQDRQSGTTYIDTTHPAGTETYTIGGNLDFVQAFNISPGTDFEVTYKLE